MNVLFIPQPIGNILGQTLVWIHMSSPSACISIVRVKMPTGYHFLAVNSNHATLSSYNYNTKIAPKNECRRSKTLTHLHYLPFSPESNSNALYLPILPLFLCSTFLSLLPRAASQQQRSILSSRSIITNSRSHPSPLSCDRSVFDRESILQVVVVHCDAALEASKQCCESCEQRTPRSHLIDAGLGSGII